MSRAHVGTGDDAQLAGMLTLTRSLVAAAENRKADAGAALDEAAAIAEHAGEGAGEHERAAQLAEAMHPDRIVAPTRRANYYVNLGRAVARLSGRRDDAVRAFRAAERISPDK